MDYSYTQLEGLDKYLISSEGFVYSFPKDRFLKQADNNGYKMVWLRDNNGNPKWYYVHRLVCMAFLPDPEPEQIWVNHKDGHKENNHVENLEWSTPSQNHQHAAKTGLKRNCGGWNKGKTHSKETKEKMAAAKRGRKHPKFKGWYITPKGRFASISEAAQANETYRKAVHTRCKKKPNKFTDWHFEPLDDKTS